MHLEVFLATANEIVRTLVYSDLPTIAFDLHRMTVDNHADAPFLLLWAAAHLPDRAREIRMLLRRNGGNSSGVGIGCVDNVGEVHPDQFWQHYSMGNVTRRSFGDIWEDRRDPLTAGLKDRVGLLPGRCRRCRFLELCNGNMRVRAEAATGDVWGEDPACYLTDEEIAPAAGKGGGQQSPWEAKVGAASGP